VDIHVLYKSSNLPALHHEVKKAGNDQFTVFSLSLMLIAIVLYVFFSYMHAKGQLSDEGFHSPYVDVLIKRDFKHLPKNVTTPPLFHAVIAFFTEISGIQNKKLEVMRFFQLLMSCAAIPFFYLVSRQLGRQNSDIRTLACTLLPISIPIWGLVYTDPPAASLSVAGMYFCLKRSHWYAALILTIGIGFRQLTIFWAFFCFMYALCSLWFENRLGFHSLKHRQVIYQLFRTGIPYALPAIALLIYSVMTGGIVSGDQQSHHIGLNAGNFFSFLIVAFVLLLPYVVLNFQRVLDLLINSNKVWLFLFLLLVWYFASFKITHGYNHPSQDWWLHNRLLAFATLEPLLKLLCFIPAAWMCLTFYVIGRDAEQPWQMWLVYSIGTLSFLPLPLVEWRYYIIALLVFILWSPVKSLVADRILALMFLFAGFFLIYGQVERIFFI